MIAEERDSSAIKLGAFVLLIVLLEIVLYRGIGDLSERVESEMVDEVGGLIVVLTSFEFRQKFDEVGSSGVQTGRDRLGILSVFVRFGFL